jgi:hypothetical protein
MHAQGTSWLGSDVADMWSRLRRSYFCPDERLVRSLDNSRSLRLLGTRQPFEVSP